MKKMIIAAAVALGMSGAFAAQTNTGCQGNCTGDTTNNTTNQGGTANGYGGTGGIGIGMGGAGGNGGSGIGVGGNGGSVVGSGNSSASGGHGGSVVGSGNSSSVGTGGSVKNAGNSNNRNDNRNDNNSNATSYGSVATTAQSTSVNVGGDVYQAPRIPVSTAYAPNIMPTAVCMGSSSMGGQGMSFGFSLGTSWTDSNCMLLEQVRTVSVVLGQKEVAQEMMMAVPAYADAVKRLQDKKAGVTKAEVDVHPMGYVSTKFDLLGN